MTMFKKPYIFVIIFLGLIFSNILITEGTCSNGLTIEFGDCNCKEWCKNIPDVFGGFYSHGFACYGDDSCPSCGPVCNTGPKGHYWVCDGPCSGAGGPGPTPTPTPIPIVDCEACSDTYRFAKKHWRAYSNCSGSIVPNSTYYTRDCFCSMYDNNHNLLACYPNPNENYDSQCGPEIGRFKLFDSTGSKELKKQKTAQGEEFYLVLYQRFHLPGSQATVDYTATRAVNCSLNCDYLSLDYIQQKEGSEFLDYPCNTNANGEVSFTKNALYPGDKASFKVSPQSRGLVKYNLTCYGPQGGPECGHPTYSHSYTATSTINLVLYDYTYREISPNEIINQIGNYLASISQIINQSLGKLKEAVGI